MAPASENLSAGVRQALALRGLVPQGAKEHLGVLN